MKEIHYDPRIDQYIAKVQPFARPILKHLRQLIHVAIPQVQETIKWGMPSFEYKGPVCSMAAFKQHAVFGLWKSELIPEIKKLGIKKEAMGSIGRITSLSDLPSDTSLKKMLRQAAELNEKGIQKIRPPKKSKKPLVVPADFAKLLARHEAAQEAFEQLSYSHKKEYLEWITEAKKEETRQRRMEQALDMLNEKKSRNWKYQQ